MFRHRVSLRRPLILWIMWPMGLLWRHFDATSADCVRVSWVHAGPSHCLFSSNNLNSLGSARSTWSDPVFSNLRRMLERLKSTSSNLNRILFGEQTLSIPASQRDHLLPCGSCCLETHSGFGGRTFWTTSRDVTWRLTALRPLPPLGLAAESCGYTAAQPLPRMHEILLRRIHYNSVIHGFSYLSTNVTWFKECIGREAW